MSNLQKLTTSVIASAMIAFVPAEANAQFLKKLGESVKKAGKEILNDASNRSSGATNAGKSNAAQNTQTTAGSTAEKQNSNVPPYYTLTITPETKWVNTQGEVSSVYLTDVHDGVWGCMLNSGWGFYRIDGTKVFDYIWEETIGREQPCFSGGALLMFKKGETGNNRQLYLLYTDGRTKALPKKYVSATNFVDGVALVGLSSGGYVFLNTDGNEVYPNVKAVPWYFHNPERRLAPLSEGLRLYRDASTDLWGYFDANGKIVIPPTFTAARSFSDGLALVTDQKQNIYFIDKTGKKAFEPHWDLTNLYMSNITDFSEGYCLQLDVDGRSVYFDKTGKEVGAYFDGTPFVNGYAWFRTDDYSVPYQVMNKNFEASKPQYQPNELNYHVDHPFPDYSKAGVALGSTSTVFKPNGDILISGEMGRKYDYIRPYDIGKFSPDNYAKASISIEGSSKRFEGFINLKGEFVLIYNWDVRGVKEVKSRYLSPGATLPLKESDYVEATIPIQICDMTPLGPK